MTNERIRRLRIAAGEAGDLAQVEICDRALIDHDPVARLECIRVIRKAAGLNDSALILAKELIAVTDDVMLRRWVAEEDLSSLRQFEALMWTRLGTDYDPESWDDAMEIIAGSFSAE